jgi:hypothetical protein
MKPTKESNLYTKILSFAHKDTYKGLGILSSYKNGLLTGSRMLCNLQNSLNGKHYNTVRIFFMELNNFLPAHARRHKRQHEIQSHVID